MVAKRKHKPLTEQGVERMKPPAKGPNGEPTQVDISDGGHPGLMLRAGSGGTKSWVFFTRWQGKQLRLRLGVYPAMSLAEARDAWRACRDAKDKGLDPASAIRPTQAAETPAADLFENVLARWLAEAHDDSKPKTRVAIKKMFAWNVQGGCKGAPNWNGRPIASITAEEAEKAVYAIADRGKLTMCGRFHSFADPFFRWAKGVRKIKANPLEGVPRRSREVQRDRTLARANEDGSIDGREIALLWRAAEVEAYPLGPLVQLLLLTACREMEIATLRWSEIQGDQIVLEGERTTNGEPHHVPLSPQAKAVLAGVPRISDCPFVFSVTGQGPFTSWSLGKARLAKSMRKFANEADDTRPLPDWRIHDLRRTAATILEALGVPIAHTEALLNHQGSKKGVAKIYQRHTYAKEKRDAANLLSAEIERIVRGPAKVLQMPVAA